METKTANLIIQGNSIPCRTNTPIWKVMQEKGLSRAAYLAVRDGVLITDDEILKPGDIIELISVVSGG